MGICHGNGPDHCCYIEGEPCGFLEEYTIPGRHWTCGLYRKYEGDWDKVHSSPEYQPVGDYFRSKDTALCGDWGPGENQCCWTGVTEVEVR